MRAKEFLTEGALSRADFKERYRLANFIKKLENREPFYTNDEQKVVIQASSQEIRFLKNELKTKFDPKNPNPKAQSLAPVEFLNGNIIGGQKLSSLMKTGEFGGIVSLSADGTKDVSKANLGTTVEALKSFAIFAKLVMRGKSIITAQDVQTVGKLSAEHSKEDYSVNPKTGKKSTTLTAFSVYSRQVPDVSQTVNDNITLKVALSAPAFQRAVQISELDKAAWGNLQGILKYVNEESDMGKYSRLFANNNKRDPLNIKVVGIDGAKTDIESTYTQPNGKEKPIQSLNLSVKAAGAEWYDQASANKLTGVYDFYRIIGLSEDDANQAVTTSNFQEGGKKDSPEFFAKRLKAVSLMFEVAYNQLKARIPQLNDKGEADYIHEFIGNLKNSISGDQKLVYVKFDASGTYEKLKPHLLMNLTSVIDLDVNFSSDPGRPTIYWIDRKTGRTLIYVVLLKVPSEHRLTFQFNLGKDFFNLLREAETALSAKQAAAQTKLPALAPANKPLGTPAAAPAKVPTKTKVQQPAAEPGDQLGAVPAEENPEKV
jgi:hypothetical protein